jgi:hypothetical protein
MTKPKRHHYMPESYMARFALNERVWLFDRKLGHIRRDSPHNVAVETDFYTVWSEVDGKDPFAEARLAELDDAGKKALDKLEERKALKLEERWFISFFIGFFDTRGQSFRRTVRDLADELSKIEARRTAERIEERARAISPEFKKGQLQELFAANDALSVPDRQLEIGSMIGFGFEFARHICWMDWVLAENESKIDFITSDRPIAVMPPEGWGGPYGSLMPRAINAFPVSGRACLLFGNQDEKRRVNYISVGEAVVKRVNDAIALRSERFVVAKHEHAVRGAAALIEARLKEQMTIIELYDQVGHRSLLISFRVREGMQSPFVARFSSRCARCNNRGQLGIELQDEHTPADPGAYTRWLDEECAGCGERRRITGSHLEPIFE